MLSILYLAGGITLLILGGEMLVRGACTLAGRFGVPPLVIGLTVVAFGTSAPELAVNILGAIAGSTGLAFGNVVGSNLANIGLILGLAALLRPLDVHGMVVHREIPMAVACGAALFIVGLDPELGSGAATIDRIDGLVLLLLFAVFIYYTVMGIVRERALARAGGAKMADAPAAPEGRLGAALLLTVGGLVGLLAGAEGTVRGAVGIARAAGMSEALIGLTIVAVGTSLPELVSTVIAARRGQADLAVGNIIGSNIFNGTMILGTTATIVPVAIPDGGRLDLAIALAFTVLLLIFSRTQRLIVRWEGALLFAGYCAYLLVRAVGEAKG